MSLAGRGGTVRLTNIKANPGDGEPALRRLCAARLSVSQDAIEAISIVKSSVDARQKPRILMVYTLDVHVSGAVRVHRNAAFRTPPVGEHMPARRFACHFEHPPMVVGAGPAGLFAALLLAENGVSPVLVERGKDVDSRSADVEKFFAGGVFLQESNVQFGEGGAGAFSDGKLSTGTRSPRHARILQVLAECGAPDDILVHAKPHIGTDKLQGVIKALRARITALGGTVLFETKLTDIITSGNVLKAVLLSDAKGTHERACGTLILAAGQSAEDTLRRLHERGVPMQSKPTAVGLRIEQYQQRINHAQYGPDPHFSLGAAEYKLNVRTPDGRGVYTFCMCPGGHVIAAAGQARRVVTNGMSLHARGGDNANAAVLVGVRPEDYGEGPLAGLDFRRALETAAFLLGGEDYRAPCQRPDDFIKNAPPRAAWEVTPTYRPGVRPACLAECLPPFVTDNLRYALPLLEERLHGFLPGAVLTGVETRTSSPVRVIRDETGQSNIRGLYPAGEGAGYAGGILSAAADGMLAAQKAMERNLKT